MSRRRARRLRRTPFRGQDRANVSRRGTALLAGSLALSSGSLLGQATPAAAAVPYPPITSVGYYISDIESTQMYDLGCWYGAAQANQSGGQNLLALLFYGATTTVDGQYGATLWGAPNRKIADIDVSAKNCARGWWDCNNTTANDNLYIALGPSNQGSYVNEDHGAAWGAGVETVRSYLSNSGFSADISARGAADIELDWSAPTNAWRWWLGHHSQSSSAVYNAGDAAGCSTTSMATNCNNGWTRADIWNISQDAVAPQIYSTTGSNAQQWYWNSRWAVANGHGGLLFRSSLSQYGACQQVGGCSGTNNTPTQSFSQLYSALAQNGSTAQTPMFMTNVYWQEG